MHRHKYELAYAQLNLSFLVDLLCVHRYQSRRNLISKEWVISLIAATISKKFTLIPAVTSLSSKESLLVFCYAGILSSKAVMTVLEGSVQKRNNDCT